MLRLSFFSIKSHKRRVCKVKRNHVCIILSSIKTPANSKTKCYVTKQRNLSTTVTNANNVVFQEKLATGTLKSKFRNTLSHSLCSSIHQLRLFHKSPQPKLWKQFRSNGGYFTITSQVVPEKELNDSYIVKLTVVPRISKKPEVTDQLHYLVPGTSKSEAEVQLYPSREEILTYDASNITFPKHKVPIFLLPDIIQKCETIFDTYRQLLSSLRITDTNCHPQRNDKVPTGNEKVEFDMNELKIKPSQNTASAVRLDTVLNGTKNIPENPVKPPSDHRSDKSESPSVPTIDQLCDDKQCMFDSIPGNGGQNETGLLSDNSHVVDIPNPQKDSPSLTCKSAPSPISDSKVEPPLKSSMDWLNSLSKDLYYFCASNDFSQICEHCKKIWLSDLDFVSPSSFSHETVNAHLEKYVGDGNHFEAHEWPSSLFDKKTYYTANDDCELILNAFKERKIHKTAQYFETNELDQTVRLGQKENVNAEDMTSRTLYPEEKELKVSSISTDDASDKARKGFNLDRLRESLEEVIKIREKSTERASLKQCDTYDIAKLEWENDMKFCCNSQLDRKSVVNNEQGGNESSLESRMESKIPQFDDVSQLEVKKKTVNGVLPVEEKSTGSMRAVNASRQSKNKTLQVDDCLHQDVKKTPLEEDCVVNEHLRKNPLHVTKTKNINLSSTQNSGTESKSIENNLPLEDSSQKDSLQHTINYIKKEVNYVPLQKVDLDAEIPECFHEAHFLVDPDLKMNKVSVKGFEINKLWETSEGVVREREKLRKKMTRVSMKRLDSSSFSQVEMQEPQVQNSKIQSLNEKPHSQISGGQSPLNSELRIRRIQNKEYQEKTFIKNNYLGEKAPVDYTKSFQHTVTEVTKNDSPKIFLHESLKNVKDDVNISKQSPDKTQSHLDPAIEKYVRLLTSDKTVLKKVDSGKPTQISETDIIHIITNGSHVRTFKKVSEKDGDVFYKQQGSPVKNVNSKKSSRNDSEEQSEKTSFSKNVKNYFLGRENDRHLGKINKTGTDLISYTKDTSQNTGSSDILEHNKVSEKIPQPKQSNQLEVENINDCFLNKQNKQSVALESSPISHNTSLGKASEISTSDIAWEQTVHDRIVNSSETLTEKKNDFPVQDNQFEHPEIIRDTENVVSCVKKEQTPQVVESITEEHNKVSEKIPQPKQSNQVEVKNIDECFLDKQNKQSVTLESSPVSHNTSLGKASEITTSNISWEMSVHDRMVNSSETLTEKKNDFPVQDNQFEHPEIIRDTENVVSCVKKEQTPQVVKSITEEHNKVSEKIPQPKQLNQVEVKNINECFLNKQNKQSVTLESSPISHSTSVGKASQITTSDNAWEQSVHDRIVNSSETSTQKKDDFSVQINQFEHPEIIRDTEIVSCVKKEQTPQVVKSITEEHNMVSEKIPQPKQSNQVEVKNINDCFLNKQNKQSVTLESSPISHNTSLGKASQITTSDIAWEQSVHDRIVNSSETSTEKKNDFPVQSNQFEHPEIIRDTENVVSCVKKEQTPQEVKSITEEHNKVSEKIPQPKQSNQLEVENINDCFLNKQNKQSVTLESSPISHNMSVGKASEITTSDIAWEQSVHGRIVNSSETLTEKKNDFPVQSNQFEHPEIIRDTENVVSCVKKEQTPQEVKSITEVNFEQGVGINKNEPSHRLEHTTIDKGDDIQVSWDRKMQISQKNDFIPERENILAADINTAIGTKNGVYKHSEEPIKDIETSTNMNMCAANLVKTTIVTKKICLSKLLVKLGTCERPMTVSHDTDRKISPQAVDLIGENKENKNVEKAEMGTVDSSGLSSQHTIIENVQATNTTEALVGKTMSTTYEKSTGKLEDAKICSEEALLPQNSNSEKIKGLDASLKNKSTVSSDKSTLSTAFPPSVTGQSNSSKCSGKKGCQVDYSFNERKEGANVEHIKEVAKPTVFEPTQLDPKESENSYKKRHLGKMYQGTSTEKNNVSIIPKSTETTELFCNASEKLENREGAADFSHQNINSEKHEASVPAAINRKIIRANGDPKNESEDSLIQKNSIKCLNIQKAIETNPKSMSKQRVYVDKNESLFLLLSKVALERHVLDVAKTKHTTTNKAKENESAKSGSENTLAQNNSLEERIEMNISLVNKHTVNPEKTTAFNLSPPSEERQLEDSRIDNKDSGELCQTFDFYEAMKGDLNEKKTQAGEKLFNKQHYDVNKQLEGHFHQKRDSENKDQYTIKEIVQTTKIPKNIETNPELSCKGRVHPHKIEESVNYLYPKNDSPKSPQVSAFVTKTKSITYNDKVIAENEDSLKMLDESLPQKYLPKMTFAACLPLKGNSEDMQTSTNNADFPTITPNYNSVLEAITAMHEPPNIQKVNDGENEKIKKTQVSHKPDIKAETDTSKLLSIQGENGAAFRKLPIQKNKENQPPLQTLSQYVIEKRREKLKNLQKRTSNLKRNETHNHTESKTGSNQSISDGKLQLKEFISNYKRKIQRPTAILKKSTENRTDIGSEKVQAAFSQKENLGKQEQKAWMSKASAPSLGNITSATQKKSEWMESSKLKTIFQKIETGSEGNPRQIYLGKIPEGSPKVLQQEVNDNNFIHKPVDHPNRISNVLVNNSHRGSMNGIMKEGSEGAINVILKQKRDSFGSSLTCDKINISLYCNTSGNDNLNKVSNKLNCQSCQSSTHNTPPKSTVGVRSKTVITSTRNSDRTNIEVFETQTFVDTRLPIPFSTESILQVFGKTDNLKDYERVLEYTKAKLGYPIQKGGILKTAGENIKNTLVEGNSSKSEPKQDQIPTITNPVKLEEKRSIISDSVRNERKSSIISEPVKLEEKSSVTSEPVKLEEKSSVTSEPVKLEEKSSVTSEPVKLEEKCSVTSEPVKPEEKSSVTSEPVRLEEKSSVIPEPVKEKSSVSSKLKHKKDNFFLSSGTSKNESTKEKGNLSKPVLEEKNSSKSEAIELVEKTETEKLKHSSCKAIKVEEKCSNVPEHKHENINLFPSAYIPKNKLTFEQTKQPASETPRLSFTSKDSDLKYDQNRKTSFNNNFQDVEVIDAKGFDKVLKTLKPRPSHKSGVPYKENHQYKKPPLKLKKRYLIKKFAKINKTKCNIDPQKIVRQENKSDNKPLIELKPVGHTVRDTSLKEPKFVDLTQYKPKGNRVKIDIIDAQTKHLPKRKPLKLSKRDKMILKNIIENPKSKTKCFENAHMPATQKMQPGYSDQGKMKRTGSRSNKITAADHKRKEYKETPHHMKFKTKSPFKPKNQGDIMFIKKETRIIREGIKARRKSLKNLKKNGFGIDLEKLNKEVKPKLDVSKCARCTVPLEDITKFPLFNKSKVLGYIKPMSGVLSVNTTRNPELAKVLATYPSVSRILNSTLTDDSKKVLRKWRVNMISELGEKGFQEFYKGQLENGCEFHQSIRSLLSGDQLSTIKSSTVLCLKSADWVLKLISDVAVLDSHVIHPQLAYRGVMDCVAKYRNNPVLIEWKRSDKPKPLLQSTMDAPVQLGAYLGGLNYDSNYNFQVNGGVIIVAYSNGAPADIIQLSLEQCKEYWQLWLYRYKQYLVEQLSERKNTL